MSLLQEEPSTDNKRKLKDDLGDKLNYLLFLLDHPRLHITEFFFGLRNEIDVEAENRLNSAAYSFEQEKFLSINTNRNDLIDYLQRSEQSVLDKINRESSDSSLIFRRENLRKEFDRIEAEIHSMFSQAVDQSSMNQDDYEEIYMKSACKLLGHIDRLEQELFGDQTFCVIPASWANEEIFGILIHLEGVFFNKHEVNCLK